MRQQSSPRRCVVLIVCCSALSVVLGCSEPALDCPAGTTAMHTDDDTVRWCARADGTAHGHYEERSLEGEVRVEGAFDDGLPDGVWRGWDELGQQRFEHTFAAGVPCGEWWDLDGDGARVERSLGACAGGGEPAAMAPEPDLAWDGQRCDGMVVQGGDEDPLATFCEVDGQRHGPFVRWAGDERMLPLAHGAYVDGLLDGPFQALWPDTGGLRLDGVFAGGLRVGTWREYDTAGHQLAVGDYEADQKTGEWVHHHPGGPVAARVPWVDGVRDGLEQRFHVDGTPAEDITWAAGERQGEFRSYHLGGLGLAEEGVYLGGQRDGVWVEYATNGTKISEGGYVDGLREGDWQLWNAQGEPTAAGPYRQGLSHGEWTLWTSQGDRRIASRGQMVVGLADGMWTGTWDTGEPFDTVTYQLGSREGAYAAFWPDGQPFAEGTFLADLPHYTWRYWHANGQLAAEGVYAFGTRLPETWSYFDEDGNPTDEEVIP